MSARTLTAVLLTALVAFVGWRPVRGQEEIVLEIRERGYDPLPEPGPKRSPDGKVGLKLTSDMEAQLYDVATGKPFGPPLRHPTNHRISTWAFSPDGKLVATGTYRKGGKASMTDGVVRVWDVASGKQLVTRTRRGHGGVDILDFSPDGKKVMVGCQPLSGR